MYESSHYYAVFAPDTSNHYYDFCYSHKVLLKKVIIFAHVQKSVI